MKRQYLLLAMGGMMMVTAGCSSDEMGSGNGNLTSGDDGISFGITLPNPTRGAYSGKAAAEKLGRNFVVHGLKYYTDAEPLSAADVSDMEKQQTVFDLYNVNYTEGTENTTQTNSTGWEYIGYTSHKEPAEEQTIRYWDYGAKAYVFSAVSGAGIKAEKVESGATVYDKGWKITVPAGGSLADIYTSERKEIKNDGSVFSGVVDLTFYSVLSKIRFAMYETVPGYDIHIDRFYYDNATSSTETNFAVDGNFRLANSSTETVFNVSFYDNTTSVENRPKVSFEEAAVTSAKYGIFGANIQAQPTIGTTSDEATYDQADGEYTVILPYQTADNYLSLRVDYTLKALSGGETIKVSGATATIPAGFLQWRENYAYTYIFKISDNTNGSTVPGGPEGLYPITFDGYVVTDEQGIQETVTNVTEPSITTYQKGQVVTENSEYEAGDIFYSVMKDKELMDIDAKAKVFEVYNCGKAEIAEKQVENYLNNELVLMPVAVADVSTLSPAGLPMADGTYQTVDAKKYMKFTAAPGKTYAIRYETSAGIYIYKVLKVVGSETKPTFSLTTDSPTEIGTVGSMVIVTLKCSSPSAGTRVMGATRLMKVFSGAEDETDKFIITEEANFTYSIKLSPDAVKAGNPSGTYTLKFGEDLASFDFTVNLSYTISANPRIAAGNADGQTIEFKIMGVLSEGEVINDNKGINVVSTEVGKYKVTAAADVATGLYYMTIGGCSVTAEVSHYDFDQKSLVLTWGEGQAAPQGLLTITPEAKGVAVASTEASVVANGNTDDASKFAFTALANGKTVLSYETASCEVTVNKYELTSDAASFAKGTGKATLTLLENGKMISARSVNVKVYRGATAAEARSATTPITTGFEVVTTGRQLVFKNLTTVGVYRIDYLTDGKVIGTETITVN